MDFLVDVSGVDVCELLVLGTLFMWSFGLCCMILVLEVRYFLAALDRNWLVLAPAIGCGQYF